MNMKPKSTSVLTICLGISVAIFFAVSVLGDTDPANYVGIKTCGICHKKDESGNQLAKWQVGPHAKAFETLGTSKAKEVAKAKGIDDPQKSGKCLKCHSTAYHFTETAVVAPEKIKPEDGVTCESCHGPGKKYMGKSVMEDRQKSIEAGMVYPASKSCELCHNDQNPTWKADRFTTKDGKKVGFDYDQAYEQIKHPDPKVKH
jgi:hypothetical protein